MNFLQILFGFMTLTIIIYSSLINFLEPKLPHFLSQLFRYGKFAVASKSKFAIEVPKAWFKHFYIFAFFEYIYMFWVVTMVYMFHMEVPNHLKLLLDCVCGKQRYAYSSKHTVYIAVLLMTLQVFRRFYDTHQVSVFGDKSKINISHYLIGMIHYPATILAILCEAPVFSNSPDILRDAPLNVLSLSVSDKIAILIFMLAWKHQHTCTKILGNLRKNKEGNIISSEYKLPQGDWFEYLSAPHQTSEMIMYTCIMWILWNNVTWLFIFIWVLANQVETILLSHWWYQEKFEDFPKKRKALIPFVY